MVRVEFRSVGAGTCSWCRKEKNEVFTVVFDDGSFSGPTELCMNDFRCAMRLKVSGTDKRTSGRPSPTTEVKA